MALCAERSNVAVSQAQRQRTFWLAINTCRKRTHIPHQSHHRTLHAGGGKSLSVCDGSACSRFFCSFAD